MWPLSENIGQLPRVSGKDPERIRGDSVVETLVCSLSVCSLSSNFLIFPSFILLLLYSTVQKSAVQYSYLSVLSFRYRFMCACIYVYTNTFHIGL